MTALVFPFALLAPFRGAHALHPLVLECSAYRDIYSRSANLQVLDLHACGQLADTVCLLNRLEERSLIELEAVVCRVVSNVKGSHGVRLCRSCPISLPTCHISQT